MILLYLYIPTTTRSDREQIPQQKPPRRPVHSFSTTVAPRLDCFSSPPSEYPTTHGTSERLGVTTTPGGMHHTIRNASRRLVKTTKTVAAGGFPWHQVSPSTSEGANCTAIKCISSSRIPFLSAHPGGGYKYLAEHQLWGKPALPTKGRCVLSKKVQRLFLGHLSLFVSRANHHIIIHRRLSNYTQTPSGLCPSTVRGKDTISGRPPPVMPSTAAV